MIEDIFFGGTAILEFTISIFIIIGVTLFSIILSKAKVIGAFGTFIATIGCYLFDLLNIYTLLIMIAFYGLITMTYFILRGRY